MTAIFMCVTKCTDENLPKQSVNLKCQVTVTTVEMNHVSTTSKQMIHI